MRLVSDTPLKITWTGCYVSFFFPPKILGYCWVGYDKSYFISTPVRSLFTENEFYPHCLNSLKKDEAQHMSDYHPISLENVVSRIISKVIADQLKLILPNVIFDAQSAFVPNWLITDNTTVAFEVLHKMRNKRRGKKGADGSKA